MLKQMKVIFFLVEVNCSVYLVSTSLSYFITVYSEENSLIPKNSSLIVVRIPLTGAQKKPWCVFLLHITDTILFSTMFSS